VSAGRVAAGTEPGGPPRANPYVGLVAFGEEDVPWFFGRDREQQVIGANLRSSRLTLLYGASGVGKSSVLQAAVLPDLRAVVARDRAAREAGDAETRPAVRFAVSVFSSWRDAPLHGLTSAVAASVHEATGEHAAPWVPGTSLRETFAGWLGPVTSLLIVLDQFEEHFLYHPQDDGPGTFAGEFVQVVNDPGLRVNFLVSLREDALAKLDRFQGRIPRLFDNYLRVDHLDLAAARRAIEGPRDEYNRRLPAGSVPAEIEPELVDAVIGEVRTHEALSEDPRAPAQEASGAAGQTGYVETPLLQLVMQRLWQAAATGATPPHLRLATLREQLGGTERIVYRHLEGALAALSEERRDLAVDVLRPLVSPAGTKIAWRAADLAYWAKRPTGEIEPILSELSSGERRILRTVTPPPSQADESPRYEIFHDILAEPILEWCADREEERGRERIARELEAQERERREAEDRRRRERRNRAVRGVAIALGALAIGLVVAVVIALDKNEVADSRALAAGATAQLPVDPERGLLLALKAVDQRDTTEATRALRLAVPASHVRAVLGAGRPRPCRACAGLATAAPRRGGGAVAGPLAIAPDGRSVAGIVGRRLRLWRPQTGATFGPSVDVGAVRGIAFTPDAARLLVVGSSASAVMAPDGTRAVLLRDARATGIGGATSPDGRRVVTTGPRGTAVWDARTGDRLSRLTDYGYGLVAFQDTRRIVLQDEFGNLVQWRWQAVSPLQPRPLADERNGERDRGLLAADPRFAVDGIARGRARVVDASRVAMVLPPGSVANPVTDVAISPDGSRIATVRESVVELWRSPRPWRAAAVRVARLVHTDGVNAVVFSADGKLVGTASTDGTARVWESATGELVAELRGHAAGVQWLGFSSRGRFVATVGEDLTIRLWDLGQERTLRVSRSVGAVAVAPAGTQVVVAEEDGALRSWDPRPGQANIGAPPGTTPLSSTVTTSVSVTRAPAGAPALTRRLSRRAAAADLHPTALAFATNDAAVLVGYDASDGAAGRVQLLRRGSLAAAFATSTPVRHVALDSRARLAAVVHGDDDGSRVELWSLQKLRPDKPIWRVPLPDAELPTDVAFSPDGRRLLVTTVFGLARVYDVRAHGTLHTLDAGTAANPGPEAFYRGVFSPDGKTVAVAGSRDVRLWDSAAGTERGYRLSGHTSVLRSVAYSADGARVVTASADGTVRVWDAADGSILAVINRHAGRVNGAAFLPNGWIVSGGEDHTVRAYPCESCAPAGELRDVAARHVTRDLSKRELAEFGG
jgi:WD40 repeat protein